MKEKIKLPLRVKSKVWVEHKDGGLIFGEGRLEILEIVDRLGSLLKAAKELKMSYRAVWGKIKATEERLGMKLVESRAGGTKGGGSKLTPVARELLKRYRELEKRQVKVIDNLFEEVFKDFL